MIVDKVLAATPAIEVAQTERETTTFRINILRALVGTVAAVTLSHTLAETTDIPYVGVETYDSHRDDFSYDYYKIGVADKEVRHQEVIDDSIDPTIVDQFVFSGSMPSNKALNVKHSEFFLIDPKIHEIDLGFGMNAEYRQEDSDAKRDKIFFTVEYEENLPDGLLSNKVAGILGEDISDPAVTSFMDFQYSVETLDKLKEYQDELGLDDFYQLQDLMVRGRDTKARSRIIAILASQYPELAEESLIVTNYTEEPDSNAPRIIERNQETSCIVESRGIVKHNLYGSEGRDANFMFAALSGAILGSLLGVQRKKTRRDPPHMKAPDTETVSRVSEGTASVTDRLRVAYWQSHLAKTQAKPEELIEARKKTRKATLGLMAACASFSALTAMFQSFTSSHVPREEIHAENHPAANANNNQKACTPDQLVYYRYVIPENPDVVVEFFDPSERPK